jgi:glycosyltransferase involved in cell wall biosynthesis
MSVTVLLPVYNGAPTLRQAIESVLAQDISEWELLIIDDASTDASGAVAKRYEGDPRITVIRHRENRGLAATLNEGLERAKHDLVARLDQDDEALPSRLRVQTAFMQKHAHVAVAGSFVVHMGATTRWDHLVELPTTPRDVARRLAKENCLYHPSVILRRDIVLAEGGYRPDFRNAEDYELWLRLAHRHDLANVPEPLIRYRFTTHGMTLGRKWEQLFYVYLAQEVNRRPGTTLAEAEKRAGERLEATSRRTFMRIVAFGTARELMRLHLWRDAMKVVLSFAPEIGLLPAGYLTLLIASARLRSFA